MFYNIYLNKKPVFITDKEFDHYKENNAIIPYKWLKKPYGTVPKNTLAGVYFKTGEKFDEELPSTANDWFENVWDRVINKSF